MSLIDLSLPALALILLAVVIYNVRVEKRRRDRSARHTVSKVKTRELSVSEKRDDDFEDDDGLFEPPPRPPREISRH